MTIVRSFPSLLLSPSLIALALIAVLPVAAQEVVQPLPGSTDADALAADMRQLASNPRDVDSLVDAARLSLRLEDIRAAAALLQRAENVDPRNPKVKAGQAAVLVQSERPGQALRYFAEAEAAGLDPGTFAADRGLAYDLTGQQEHAQRDYARALRDHPGDEETIRRYALSLGISGQRQRALALLDPMVRRSDRAAWRAQAFVLAMTGDVGGASRIASTMIPGGAAGLSAFFERLPALPAIDRAFAIHFGEVRASPERLADARLAPPVSRDAGVALASAQPPAAVAARARPVVQPKPVVPAVAVAALPPRQAVPVPVASVPARPVATVATPPVALAATRPTSGAVLAEARETAVGTLVSSTAAVATAPMPVAPIPVAPIPVAPVPVAPVPVATTASVPTPVDVPPVATPSPQQVQVVALPPSASPVPVRVAAPARTAAGTRVSEDSILAKIIAGLSIPGSELGVESPAHSAPVAAPPPAHVAAGHPEPARAEVAVADGSAAEQATADRLAAAKAAADKRAADRKAIADRKVLAEKKAAADKKALADKLAAQEAAEKKKLERANPQRIWVQVAGGAYEGDLPKAYAAVKAKAPATFGSRSGWTTPLRATNRVLTGPFKTDAEARAFVNDLKKNGIGAFTFTSDAGQPVNRLGGK